MNDYLVLIIIAAYPYVRAVVSRKMVTAYTICCAIGIIADVDSFGRTLIAALIACAVAVWSYVAGRKRPAVTVFLGAASVLACYGLLELAKQDYRVGDLFSQRITSIISSRERLADRQDIFTRLPLYDVYWDGFVRSFPLGQGLGRPLSGDSSTDLVMFSDVSVVALVLPFGLLGLVTCWVFVRAIIQASRHMSPAAADALKRGLVVVVCVSLLVSMNEDIFTRRTFVVYLSYLAAAMTGCQRRGGRAPVARAVGPFG